MSETKKPEIPPCEVHLFSIPQLHMVAQEVLQYCNAASRSTVEIIRTPNDKFFMMGGDKKKVQTCHEFLSGILDVGHVFTVDFNRLKPVRNDEPLFKTRKAQACSTCKK